VIACRDRQQWILQRRSATWEARSFCRTSEALKRVVREHVGAVDLPDLPKWLAEPDRPKRGLGADFQCQVRNFVKPRPTGLSGPRSGRLSPCFRWRLWGPELSERSLRFATLCWNEAVSRGTTDFVVPEPPPPAPPVTATAIPLVPSPPLAPADDAADPFAIPAFLVRE
jgi:hypothetical protein